jgi:hypothetical protein
LFTDTVSVAGDSVILPRHFGSLYSMADYTSEAHNIYLTTSFMATPKLNLTGSINYNMSKGELEQVTMPEMELGADTILSHQDFTFDEMHNYSKLDFGFMQFGFGAEYQVSPRVLLSANADYADLKDNTGYVYGIESGSYFMIRSGVRIEF